MGIDGEGQTFSRYGVKGGDHRYVLLAAATEDGERFHISDPEGLGSEHCLDFIVSLPANCRIFGYSLGYDWTMILRDLPDAALYKLFRPDLRQRPKRNEKKGPKPIKWRGFLLNMQGSKFTIERGGRSHVIWDIFKFYQSRFTGALKDWKVAEDKDNTRTFVESATSFHGYKIRCSECDEDVELAVRIEEPHGKRVVCIPCSLKLLPLVERMRAMKEQRALFDRLSPADVQQYCFEECACMATLAHKLVDAHTACGLELTSFYGAGSTTSAMFKKIGIKQKLRDPPQIMGDVPARAFFGGRFENSIIGRAEGLVWNYDISSAYPYQITFLPCLLHGMWEHTIHRRDLDSGIRTAFVRYRLGEQPRDEKFQAWGPFPFRLSSGSIAFPTESGGGWVGLDEYLQGEKLFHHVQFAESWIYRCDCDCQPFKEIPEYFKERVRIGKEGPGIVLKLGCNAGYGKLAQSIGSAQFNNWIWASLITSGTRAQMLELLGLHADWSNLLMIATDGVYTRERIKTPIPRDTGTWELPCPKTDKNPSGIQRTPLGGWEEKAHKRGVFVARPGIYFPMYPDAKDLKDVRGRGVGKATILNHWAEIVDAWEKHGLEKFDPATGEVTPNDVIVTNVSRFCGAVSSIHRSGSEAGGWTYTRANGMGECTQGCTTVGCGHVPSYGQWITRPVQMSFNPLPKRERVDPVTNKLELRKFPCDVESRPYSSAIKSRERLELEAATREMFEQPDCDFSEDYDLYE
jgi:hypothetical protein